MQACEQPRYFPLAAPGRDYLTPGLRVTFTGNYAVYYQHDDRHLVIVRVLQGARDIDALAGHGGFGEAST